MSDPKLILVPGFQGTPRHIIDAALTSLYRDFGEAYLDEIFILGGAAGVDRGLDLRAPVAPGEVTDMILDRINRLMAMDLPPDTPIAGFGIGGIIGSMFQEMPGNENHPVMAIGSPVEFGPFAVRMPSPAMERVALTLRARMGPEHPWFPYTRHHGQLGSGMFEIVRASGPVIPMSLGAADHNSAQDAYAIAAYIHSFKTGLELRVTQDRLRDTTVRV